MKRRSGLNPMSSRRRREQAQRTRVRDAVYERDGQCVARMIPVVDLVEVRCPVLCGGPFDVHEVIGRGRGGDYLDAENCVLLCRQHHDWVTTHPEGATRLGLTRSLPPATDGC